MVRRLNMRGCTFFLLCFVLFLGSFEVGQGQSCQYTGCFDANAPCCSQYGYCGASNLNCDPAQGCVSGCWPAGAATNGTGYCQRDGCKYNINGRCCGRNGLCGSTAYYCDANQGCVSGCWTATDGCKLNGCTDDPTEKCCSQYGYCGNTADHCAVENNCISGCWPVGTKYTQPAADCRSGGCPDSHTPCCSAWGECGNTAGFCDKTQGCVSGCWKVGNSSSQNLISQLVHTGFIANTRSALWWPSARALFFNVIDKMYNLTQMRGVKWIWTAQKQLKTSAEAQGDVLWMGNPPEYIDNVIPQVTDSSMIDLLKVLKLSAVRMAATKPQECGTGPESSTFCKITYPTPTYVDFECTKYNCFFNPGSPCSTFRGNTARCSSPAFFSNNGIQCPSMGCKTFKKRNDIEMSNKRHLSRSLFSDLLRRRLKRELRSYAVKNRRHMGEHVQEEERGYTTRAVCPTMTCDTCGMTSDTFTAGCGASYNGVPLCCSCAYDFGAPTFW